MGVGVGVGVTTGVLTTCNTGVGGVVTVWLDVGEADGLTVVGIFSTRTSLGFEGSPLVLLVGMDDAPLIAATTPARPRTQNPKCATRLIALRWGWMRLAE